MDSRAPPNRGNPTQRKSGNPAPLRRAPGDPAGPGPAGPGGPGPAEPAGRKRIPNRDTLTAEDDALSRMAREAEARLAAKRAARAEARDIGMKELERQQKEASDDEDKMSVGRRGSFRPSDYCGFYGCSSRAYSRTSSRASSGAASPVGLRTTSAASAAIPAALGGASSRRGSCDTPSSMETEASIRDITESLVEMEEKYRKAMVSNAQLHNEKSSLMYQVETLKEELIDMEELLWESRRHGDHTSKAFERERQAHRVLQTQFKEMKETLRQHEELQMEVSDLHLKISTYRHELADLQEVLQWKDKKIQALERHREMSDIVRIDRDHLRDEALRLTHLLKQHGVVISPDIVTNGETGQEEEEVGAEPASQLAGEQCHGSRERMLELRLKKLFEERESLYDQVRLMQHQLDERHTSRTDRVQNAEGGVLESTVDAHLLVLQREANKQMSDLKFKLLKSQQEVTTLEHNVTRLEGQVTRYKMGAENAEKVEEDLKVEKRKLHRELRSALDRIEELEATNSQLSKRLEKMKANRNALLGQQ